MSGNLAAASAALTNSSGSPKVRAHAAWRRSSCMRSGEEASRSEPTSRQPHASPSSRYSATESIIIRVSGTLERSWPTSPAEWNVEPLVSSARSTSTTSRSPAATRCAAIDPPPTPPPTTTTRARPGSSRGRKPSLQALEMLSRIRGEVDVEVGARGLHEPPRRLAQVADDPHPVQVAEPVLVAEVRAQQRPVVGIRVGVVDAQVGEVEQPLVHPRVLPVDDPDAVAVADEVRAQQVVV